MIQNTIMCKGKFLVEFILITENTHILGVETDSLEFMTKILTNGVGSLGTMC